MALRLPEESDYRQDLCKGYRDIIERKKLSQYDPYMQAPEHILFPVDDTDSKDTAQAYTTKYYPYDKSSDIWALGLLVS